MHANVACLVLGGVLAFACDAQPDAATPSPATTPSPNVSPTPDPATPTSPAAPETASNDAAAEQLAIQAVGGALYWPDDRVIHEVLLAFSTGAWSLQSSADGVVLHAKGAPRLAQRLGLADGDLVTAIDGHAIAVTDAARDLLARLDRGDRVSLTLRRGTQEQTNHYRVDGLKRSRTRLEDLLALTLRRGTKSEMDRALLVAIGEAADALSRDPTPLLELLNAPTTTPVVTVDGEPIEAAMLAVLLGAHATANRVEIGFDGRTEVLEIVSGNIESTVLADALRGAARSRPGPRGGLTFDPSAPTSGEPEPLVGGGIFPGIELVDESHAKIERNALIGLLDDPLTLSKAARVVPANKEGVPSGFKIYGIRSSSPFKAVGFRNGDLVEAINGTPITDIDGALKVFTKVRKVDEIEVSISRRLLPMTLRIEIVEKL